MIRVPPPLASWLLENLGGAYHAESLAGDLAEQYQRDRSRGWYWRQVAAAIVIGRVQVIRDVPWASVGRAVSRVLAQGAAVLALIGVIALGMGTLTRADTSRRAECPGAPDASRACPAR